MQQILTFMARSFHNWSPVAILWAMMWPFISADATTESCAEYQEETIVIDFVLLTSFVPSRKENLANQTSNSVRFMRYLSTKLDWGDRRFMRIKFSDQSLWLQIPYSHKLISTSGTDISRTCTRQYIKQSTHNKSQLFSHHKYIIIHLVCLK